MIEFTEQHLARLIRSLPPAPDAWVRAAVELPAARIAIDELIARAGTDRSARAKMLADPEAAMRNAGIEPQVDLVADLRAHLIGLDDE